MKDRLVLRFRAGLVVGSLLGACGSPKVEGPPPAAESAVDVGDWVGECGSRIDKTAAGFEAVGLQCIAPHTYGSPKLAKMAAANGARNNLMTAVDTMCASLLAACRAEAGFEQHVGAWTQVCQQAALSRLEGTVPKALADRGGADCAKNELSVDADLFSGLGSGAVPRTCVDAVLGTRESILKGLAASAGQGCKPALAPPAAP